MTKLIIIAAMLLSGCSAMTTYIQPPKPITVYGTVRTVSDKIVRTMLNDGYIARNTNPLIFDKKITGFIDKMLYSSKLSSRPIYRVTCSVISSGDSTSIFISYEAISNPYTAFEKPSRIRGVGYKQLQNLIIEGLK